MIHSNSLKNAKPLVQELMNKDQIVMQYVLDKICEEIKKADEDGVSYIFINLKERNFTKVTLQILTLYGYRVEFNEDDELEYTYIRWNKL